MPFPDRTDRPSVQECGCFAEECPEPVNIGALYPDGSSGPYWICNHDCPADNHGSRHYVTKNRGHAARAKLAAPVENGKSHIIELLHVYSQEAWHNDLMVVGNLDGLTALRDAVDNAIELAKLRTGIEQRQDVVVRTTGEAMTSDGEGFDIRVLLDNRPWYDTSIDSSGKLVWDYCLPYSEDYAKSEEGRDPQGEWYICDTCGRTFNEHATAEETPGEDKALGHVWKPRLTGDPAPKEA